jgi:hypothetical protein
MCDCVREASAGLAKTAEEQYETPLQFVLIVIVVHFQL